MLRWIRRAATGGLIVAAIVAAAATNPGGLGRYGDAAEVVQLTGTLAWALGMAGHVTVDTTIRRRVAEMLNDPATPPSTWDLPDGWSVEIVPKTIHSTRGEIVRWGATITAAGRSWQPSWRLIPAAWVGADPNTDLFPTRWAAGNAAARVVASRS